MSNLLLKFSTPDGWLTIADVLEYSVIYGIFREEHDKTGKIRFFSVSDDNERLNTVIELPEGWSSGNPAEIALEQRIPAFCTKIMSRNLVILDNDRVSLPLPLEELVGRGAAKPSGAPDSQYQPYYLMLIRTGEGWRAVLSSDVCYLMSEGRTIQRIDAPPSGGGVEIVG